MNSTTVENINVLFYNFEHLLNMCRLEQSRDLLIKVLEKKKDEYNEILNDLDKNINEMEKLLDKYKDIIKE